MNKKKIFGRKENPTIGSVRQSMTENIGFDSLVSYEGISTSQAPTENTLENRVHRHLMLVHELNDIYRKKNMDYGDSFHHTFEEEGFAMSRIRLSDKLSRFKNLTLKGEGGAQVSDESIRDTLMDLANYAIMTVLEMERCSEGE